MKALLRDNTSLKRIIIPNKSAIAILTAGPAKATLASPHFWSLRL